MANATMLTVATFGMAPGGYRQVIEDYLAENGANTTANTLVRLLHLDGSANYRTLADTVTQNLLGSVATAEQATMVRDYIFEQLSSGVDAGHLINLLSDVIDNISHSDANWGRVATRFDNIHDVAEYYASMAGNSASTDMMVLRHYVEDVSDDSNSLYQFKIEIDDSFGGGSGGGGSGGGDDGGSTIPDDFLALQSLVTLNNQTGVLSTASLRAAIIAQTSEIDYQYAFDPSIYDDGDGVLTASELGLTQFASLPATLASIESLYFGTAIKALQSIDEAEIVQLGNYVTAHQAELENGALPQEYIDLLISIFSDPGNPPLFSDSMIAEAIVTGTVAFIVAVNSGEDVPLFNFSDFASFG